MRLRFAAPCVVLSFLFYAPLCLSQRLSPATEHTNLTETTLHSTPVIKSYHDHSIRDIEAVGNRNVGCGRGQHARPLHRDAASGAKPDRMVMQTL